LARSVSDVARCLDVIAGPDPLDATSSSMPAGATRPALRSSVADLRVGVPRHLLRDGIDAAVLAAFQASLQVYADRGAHIIDIELPHSSSGIAVYYLVATAEASSNLARYDGVRYGRRAGGDGPLGHMYDATREAGFGAEVKRRIMLGTYVLSAGYYDAYYRKAQQVRTLIGRDYERAFAQVDVIALPTTPTAAFRLGERTADPLQMYLADIFTVGAPLAGLPAISVPCGLTSERLPVGLQLIGRPWQDAALLQVADAYTRHTDWTREHP
jgi:aspartyl-tRNA(Asn)/glutamyl-tRNA(Gln) amidotransferase subunit A